MPALLLTLAPTNETMNINGVILLGRMSLFTLCFEYVQQSYIARERGSSRTFLLPCPPQFPPVLPKFDFNKKEQKRQENRKKPHCNFWHVAMECNKKKKSPKRPLQAEPMCTRAQEQAAMWDLHFHTSQPLICQVWLSMKRADYAGEGSDAPTSASACSPPQLCTNSESESHVCAPSRNLTARVFSSQ